MEHPSDAGWQLLGSRNVGEHRLFRIRYDRYRLDRTGAEQDFIVLEMRDWVHVLPITEGGQIVLVRQYRHGIRQSSLEAPGGVMDPGESPADAAARELREETGCTARRLVPLGRIAPNPAIQNNWCHVFLAEDCRRSDALDLDPLEKIDVEVHPLGSIPQLIADGQITHALVLASLGLAGWAR